MTLCAIWRDDDDFIHMASDSRLTLAGGSVADIGIKITRERVEIRGPDSADQIGSRIWAGDLAYCFAGSGVGAVHLKESLTGILRYLQATPGHTDVSFGGIADLVFSAYKIITRKLCEAVAEKGFYQVVVAGCCPTQGKHRAFIMNTLIANGIDGPELQYSLQEILTGTERYKFIGSGVSTARQLAHNMKDSDLTQQILSILKVVVDDSATNSVGGSIQYGRFQGSAFDLLGVLEIAEQVHYWRGALDLRCDEFERNFIISYPLLVLDELKR